MIGGGVAVAGGAALATGRGGSEAGGGSPQPAVGTSLPTTATTTTTLTPAAAAALGFLGGNPAPGSSVRDPGGSFTLDLALDVTVRCSADVPNARLFVTLRRGGAACVNSWTELVLAAGASRTVSVRGFVVAQECRPVPFSTDTVWLRLYDMNGSATVPLGEASVAVAYRIVP